MFHFYDGFYVSREPALILSSSFNGLTGHRELNSGLLQFDLLLLLLLLPLPSPDEMSGRDQTKGRRGKKSKRV